MSNPGTSTQPWSTLEAVFTAKKVFAGGDVIYLRTGYHGVPTISGTNTSAVTIQPDTGASPKLKTLAFNNALRWVVTGLDICPANLAPGTYITGNLVDIKSTSPFNTLQNCTIKAAVDITLPPVVAMACRISSRNSA